MKKLAIKITVLCGLFLLIDRFFKWQTLAGWSEPRLVNSYFGWLPFFNPGVAFGIPVPNVLVVSVTIPIMIVIIYLLDRELSHTPSEVHSKLKLHTSLALGAILTGSVSNLIDRLWLHHTIDYLLVGTSVINVADVLIVAGFVLYLLTRKQENKKTI